MFVDEKGIDMTNINEKAEIISTINGVDKSKLNKRDVQFLTLYVYNSGMS
jgi:hypothetical protein